MAEPALEGPLIAKHPAKNPAVRLSNLHFGTIYFSIVRQSYLLIMPNPVLKNPDQKVSKWSELVGTTTWQSRQVHAVESRL